MANPFDNEEGKFLVLINDEGQHSLWPTFAAVPAGWTVTADESGRAEALAAVERDWTDMRPKSLAAHSGN
ncbi:MULTISPECIES: MbtH family protein [unclassified Streptomyces]|uniref:MbtH family protein n=1 Tax=unclassified Streptomyces TaxID=2593676 RepID=UPI0006AD8DB7|nr:MbtH family protein [Streptomyces sp. WM6378]KOU53430.1 protein mbtH [Streptomyces sp. WM6378]